HRTDSTLKLSIRGWVTLILKLMRVPLKGKFENARLMDIPYLAKLRPLQEMYVEMRRMSRWNKFQERVIRKLVNEVNSLSQFSQPPRQRRPRRHIGSPPTPESDIESPTFSTDDEEFDSSRYY
ncbi:unnamed protein product, partial [Cochlearia groenlandica]